MFSNDVVIDVKNVSKCFEMYDSPSGRLKQFILPRFNKNKKYYKEYWALRDINFQVRKGETVGILGGNGAGKSTLLQIICNTLMPTTGQVDINGRVAALLELGSGFNPEFTGLENVYMSCSLLGLSKEETENRLDSILGFADIGDFIYQPVKTYSSGMFVRLAFAVNVQSQPEVMIVDEALSVGDMNFQAKCMTALKRIQDDGASILFVSHDTGSVKSLCERGVLLEKGQLIEQGPAADVAENYIKRMRLIANKSNSCSDLGLKSKDAQRKKTEDTAFTVDDEFVERVKGSSYGDGGVEVVSAKIIGENGFDSKSFTFDEKVKVQISFKSDIEETIGVAYYILDDKKNSILGSGPKQAHEEFTKVKIGGRYCFTYETKLPLTDGAYSLQIQINKPVVVGKRAKFLQVIDNASVFKVEEGCDFKVWSKVYLDNKLTMEEV
ncbi:ABC transporter ATP-binding protein [Vibrio aestuarianus]|uniref:ABC transporter ATP-binding protein n=1 Tax=Vibrio aestuarianus TaxID=28171 RepID=A0AAX3U1F1_9VIBR|nr:ABC transporter ATP-binding protein [Vibrio aestuarianus]WGK81287.1 ABC transporter ATP-binding protein [Vibrio aestuarianus]